MGTYQPPVQAGAHVPPAQSTSRAPQVQFLVSEVPPPAVIYMQQDDQLFVQCRCNLPISALPIIVRGRYMLPDGTIRTIEQDIPTVLGLSQPSIFIPLGECYLFAVDVLPNGNWCGVGQLHVSISIVRYGISLINSVQCLAAGMCTMFNPVSWPASGIRSAVDSQGFIRSIQGTVPAAGAEISESVPSGVRWRLLSIFYSLQASAAVANRISTVTIFDGVHSTDVFGPGITQTAGILLTYTNAKYANPVGALPGIGNRTSLPDIILPPTWAFKTLTAGLQAGDQYSAPQYVVEEWQTGVAL